jgi:O-antigen ligase
LDEFREQQHVEPGSILSNRSLSFFLFVILTGVLFVRPTELVESLQDAPVYEVVILCCLATASPRVIEQLRARSLKSRPISFYVLGLLAAVALSHLSHLALGPALVSTWTFSKVVLAYLLLVGVLNIPARLRQYLVWLQIFIFTLTTLSLAQHYGVIDNPALAAHQERIYDKETGDEIGFSSRLCGAGIFANPNDLSRILVVGIGLSLYFMGSRTRFKPLWLVALGVFGHALLLTESRGGFIAFIVMVMVLFHARFGTLKSVALACLVLPALALAIGGRQTDLSTSGGTGQQRIRLWSDGLVALQSSPVFGTGMGTYPEITGRLGAHNSFVETYVELGFFGGSLFVGAVVGALRVCVLLGGRNQRSYHPELKRLRPYLLGIIAGYAAGMLTSSRCYAVPTYLLLGLVDVMARLAGANVVLPGYRVSSRSVLRLVLLSIAILVTIKFYVVSAAQFGGE